MLQDRKKIYLNFAKYRSKYLSYLRGEGTFDETDPDSFMTSNLKSMELVPIILAFTLRAAEDEKEELSAAQK